MEIILRNDTTANIAIDDLYSQTIPAGQQIRLDDLHGIDAFRKSTELMGLIMDGSLIVNDGIEDLTPTDGTNHIEVMSKYEILKLWGGGIAVSRGINFTMSDHQSHDYVANGDITYLTLRSFLYDGTTIWTPEKFSVIGSMANASAVTGYARLYDYTNNNQIIEVTWGVVNKNVYTSSVISNLPTSPAILELQTKTENRGKDIRLHYMALY